MRFVKTAGTIDRFAFAAAILVATSAFAAPPTLDQLAHTRPAGKLELFATIGAPMPTGITVSHTGRVFVNFPRWGDKVPCTVAELVDGRVVPYPSRELNDPNGHPADQRLVSVQSVVVDPANRLWLLDTGRIEWGPTAEGGAKLVCVDLDANRVAQIIVMPPDVALPTTYLNDIRFDLAAGAAGYAYITDSSTNGPNAIIVVDLATGTARRRLNDHASTKAADFLPIVEGQPLLNRPAKGAPQPMTVGADGIALSAAGDHLYYRPLSSRHLYRIATAALRDATLDDEALGAKVEDLGDTGFASDGLEADDRGRIYLTDYEDNAVVRFDPESGRYETLVTHPALLWPDTLAIAGDGYLYGTANQLHRQPGFQGGVDRRDPPYLIFRVPIDAGPVRLQRKPTRD